MRCHSVELQLNVLVAVGGIELERAAIPTDAARPIALLLFRFWVERLFHRPIVRQVDLPPVRIIEPTRRRAPDVSGLSAAVRDVRAVKPDALAAGK